MNSAFERQAERLRDLALAAIEAAAPGPVLRRRLTLDRDLLRLDGRCLDLSGFERVLVLGAGKAAAAMARAVEDLLGPRLWGGLVVTKYGHGLALDRIELAQAAHPVPDRAGERAALRMLSLARAAGNRDLVLFLLSGGASALTACPRPPLTLAAKQALTRRLLECGAEIQEINALRKHLSLFKGGRLAKTLEPAAVLGLTISDVVGDRLEVIGSGPIAPDATSFGDCLAILDKYGLTRRVGPQVLDILEKGALGQVPETVRPGDPCFERVQSVILANNMTALQGAARAAAGLGFEAEILEEPLEGEAGPAGERLAALAAEVCRRGDRRFPVCLLAGGETTVTVSGRGRGGRNQELVLSAGLALSRLPEPIRTRVSLACLGTDGQDGPTDAAGAVVLPDTMRRARDLGLDPEASLADNDSHTFFKGLGGLLVTGPTRTNVMDVAAVLIDAP
ncbi:MAG: DUF4147 domain-containing protein [Desulfovibrionaceae bacterium]|nr:DUF4147 domain-containing protein [Desulfovibrionaceae bacterium]